MENQDVDFSKPILSDYTLSNYNAACKKLKSCLEIYRKDFIEKCGIDIMTSIEFRIKDNKSIINKLLRDEHEITEENAIKYVRDIVGIRIISPNLLDVRILKYLLTRRNCNAFKILESKDYISNAKESGYRSYHFIVQVPLDLCDECKYITCEIQLRTLLMHAWCKFEHDKCYKSDNVDEELKKMLKQQSDTFFDADIYMMNRLLEDVNSKEKDFSLAQEDFIILGYIEELLKKKSQKEQNPPVLTDNTIANFEAARDTVITLLENIQSDFKAKYGYDIISSIEDRIKSNNSLINKLKKDEKPVTEESALQNIRDIAGIRVIAPNLLDVLILIKLLEKSCSFDIIKEKDYLDSGKESGYRSFHMIIGVPVNLCDGLRVVTVEIQIRTLLMHAWSHFEHDKCYKTENVDHELEEMLKKQSDEYYEVDKFMRDNLITSKRSEKDDSSEYIYSLIRGKR